MPKISELNAITSVANTDLLMVVHDPNGSPSTNKITVNNFISSVGSQLRGYTGSAGTGGGTGVLPEDGLDGQILYSNGTSAVWKFNPDTRAIGAIYEETSYTASEYDSVILVVPATQGQPITITLPGTVPVGKIFTIRNIDSSGGQFPVIVNTNGVVGLIEDPHFGNIVNEYYIQYTGDTESWIFDGNYYRNISPISSSPLFLTSANSYHQVVLQNTSNANNASSDWVAYNNEGDYLNGIGPFVDMGINSNTYSDTSYGDVWGPSDSYIYNYGGNLIIGPQTDHSIKLIAGNTNIENIMMTINSSSVHVNTNIIIPDGGDILRNGISIIGTGQIDGGNAFTTPTAEITVDGGGA